MTRNTNRHIAARLLLVIGVVLCAACQPQEPPKNSSAGKEKDAFPRAASEKLTLRAVELGADGRIGCLFGCYGSSETILWFQLAGVGGLQDSWRTVGRTQIERNLIGQLVTIEWPMQSALDDSSAPVYIWLEGELLNARIVRNGYAEYHWDGGAPLEHEALFRA
jgi:hypothetical protein